MQDPSLGPFDPAQVQIHDFNTGDLNPTDPQWFVNGGAFWTNRVPDDATRIRPGRGDAHFAVNEYAMQDWVDVVNAVFRSGPNPVPTMANVEVHWMGTGERQIIRNDAPLIPYKPFGGQYERATAMVDWSAVAADGYAFNTAFSTETTITSAYTAKVRNGRFYP